MDLEQTLFYIVLAGFALAAVGALWLLVIAFRTRILWGLALLFVLPALVFVPRHWRRTRAPVLLLAVAGLIIATPYAINYYHHHFVDLGPREKLVAGELHITLTGWDGTDYSILRSRPRVVVLQMANPDVTDATLEFVRGMQLLRELDLNDTQVTDAGLKILREVPALEELRLRGAKVSDEGFRQWLNDRETLRKLDLRGTAVTAKTLRTWKSAAAGREYLR